mmetsp:Transcript_11117/g.31017  ORF Transcript_11117/g.31017 Transcript_11117/m.31017 type:complete len:227 (+) Transcript_11117:98-778(+)
MTVQLTWHCMVTSCPPKSMVIFEAPQKPQLPVENTFGGNFIALSPRVAWKPVAFSRNVLRDIMFFCFSFVPPLPFALPAGGCSTSAAAGAARFLPFAAADDEGLAAALAATAAATAAASAGALSEAKAASSAESSSAPSPSAWSRAISAVVISLISSLQASKAPVETPSRFSSSPRTSFSDVWVRSRPVKMAVTCSRALAGSVVRRPAEAICGHTTGAMWAVSRCT